VGYKLLYNGDFEGFLPVLLKSGFEEVKGGRRMLKAPSVDGE